MSEDVQYEPGTSSASMSEYVQYKQVDHHILLQGGTLLKNTFQ